MDAVVMAGGIPRQEEPLYALCGGRTKALLPVAGKPMVQWVLDALAASRHVGGVVVVGLDGGLEFPRGIRYLAGEGDMLDNARLGARAILESDPQASRVLVISSDIPAITAAHIDWVIEQALAAEDEFHYCVLERAAMERVFPGCRRTFFRFRGAEVCGGDLAVVAASVFSNTSAAWQRLSEARKSRWRMAATIGFDVLLLLLLRLLSIDGIVRRASRRLGVRGRVLRCPYPEVGMDVDKPFQLEIVSDYLGRRASG